jgi:UDP-3-O-[3-hydroxymyristoyl] glucosamine N-acyltransferase
LKNCNIGKDVYIDVDVEIGNNVKIQNGVSVYRGVKVEDDVFLGPHMTFTNDLYPRSLTKIGKLLKP